MTLTMILTIMGLKYLQTSMPKWRRDVDAWIKEDMEGFLKFKNEVFEIIESSKNKSESNGFEIINHET